MSTKDNKDDGKMITARVEVKLKNRLKQYCKRPEVDRSESFITRQAIEEFLDKRAPAEKAA